jgi:hypothetical protein
LCSILKHQKATRNARLPSQYFSILGKILAENAPGVLHG